MNAADEFSSTGNTQKLCITTTLCNVQAMLGQPLNIGTLVADTPRILSSKFSADPSLIFPDASSG